MNAHKEIKSCLTSSNALISEMPTCMGSITVNEYMNNIIKIINQLAMFFMSQGKKSTFMDFKSGKAFKNKQKKSNPWE